MPNGPGYHRERPDITANGPGYHRERPRASPRTPPGITANAAEVSPRTALVLSAGPGASHREQRRFFPRAPVPASFY